MDFLAVDLLVEAVFADFLSLDEVEIFCFLVEGDFCFWVNIFLGDFFLGVEGDFLMAAFLVGAGLRIFLVLFFFKDFLSEEFFLSFFSSLTFLLDADFFEATSFFLRDLRDFVSFFSTFFCSFLIFFFFGNFFSRHKKFFGKIYL
jgi:hypothetical protein